MDASVRNSINVPKWTSPAMWVVMTSSCCSRVRNWLARCERITASFNALAQGLFDYTARERGGIDAEDRHGCPRRPSFDHPGVRTKTWTEISRDFEAFSVFDRAERAK